MWTVPVRIYLTNYKNWWTVRTSSPIFSCKWIMAYYLSGHRCVVYHAAFCRELALRPPIKPRSPVSLVQIRFISFCYLKYTIPQPLSGFLFRNPFPSLCFSCWACDDKFSSTPKIEMFLRHISRWFSYNFIPTQHGNAYEAFERRWITYLLCDHTWYILSFNRMFSFLTCGGDRYNREYLVENWMKDAHIY